MAYFSKQTILSAYKCLQNLTSDPSAQGATQATSILRYLFALDEFYSKNSRDCKTSSKEDKDEFIKFVGNVVSVNNSYYTANFYNSIKDNADYAVGSNFFSVNVVKNSTENPSKKYEYPKRGNNPVFYIKNGNLIWEKSLLKNLDSFLHNNLLKSSFAIWLLRNHAIDKENLIDSMVNVLKETYTSDLVECLISDSLFEVDFVISFSDEIANFEISDFPKQRSSNTQINNSIMQGAELAKSVRESFLKYWSIIDQHGAQFDMYLERFEAEINANLIDLNIGVKDIFEVIDFEQYKVIISNIISKNPDLSYLNNEKGPDGARYYIWSTNRHYRNYLNILSVSNFFVSLNDQRNKVISRLSSTVSFDKNLLTAMRTKPFLLLAGISGTGKSRIVKQMAFECCPEMEALRTDKTSPGNYQLIEVKPNWHDSTEVLGYESEIGGKHYVVTPFVKFLVKAMCYEDKAPFFVCMDEMNLAPVEQYFAEFLSVLESRKLVDGKITSEPLIKADIFKKYGNDLKAALFDLKKVDNNIYGNATSDEEADYGSYNEVYDRLMTEGLRLPSNLIVVGTVNMDETTHQFSRKVIDRAMTIEMNIEDEETPFIDFFGKSGDLSYPQEVQPKELFLPMVVQASEAMAQLPDDDSKHLQDNIPAMLLNLNKALNGTPFKIAYRVQNELVLYYHALRKEQPDTPAEELLAKAMEAILMLKVLPRIEGDEDLLEKPLDKLAEFVAPYPEASKKVAEMQARLKQAHFASFWP